MSRANAKRPARKAARREHIESQRRRLNKAVAVLVGAELTAEYCPEMALVTDAVGVARDLIEQSIDALDSRNLKPQE